MRPLLTKIVGRYDAIIWIRVLGTVLTTLASFMLRPFLVLYLHDRLDGNLVLAAVVTGLQPLTGMVAGIWAGALADRLGRKPMMVLSLAIQSASMAGYVWADSLPHFVAITVVNGIGGSFFWPAASAQIADVVPEHRRSEVFALLHTAVNVGAAAGPLLGVIVFRIDPRITFSICSGTLMIYALLVAWKVPETLHRHAAPIPAAGPTVPAPRFRLFEHGTLLGMTLAALPVALLYSQVEVVLPLHFMTRFGEAAGLQMFATLVSINGSLVVAGQLLIARRAERFRPDHCVLVAYASFAMVGIGYGWAPTFLLLVVAEAIFTFGEMLFGPVMQKAVSVLAPAAYRGRYFAIWSLHHGLMRSVGPPLGAFVYGRLGGSAWFSLVAGAVALTAIVQFRLVGRASRGPVVPTASGTRQGAPAAVS